MKLSFKAVLDFIKKFTLGYIKALILPFVAMVIGFLIMFTTGIFRNSVSVYLLLLIDLVALVIIVWAAWRAYLVGYSLNYAAYDYLKEDTKDFKEYVNVVNKESGAIIKFLLYLTLLFAFIFIAFFTILSILKYTTTYEFLMPVGIIVFSIINILLVPFGYYAMTSFFFRNSANEKQGFWKLFKNCYKYLDGYGVLIIVLAMISAIIIGLIPYISPILNLFLAMILTIINVNWYKNRIEAKKD